MWSTECYCWLILFVLSELVTLVGCLVRQYIVCKIYTMFKKHGVELFAVTTSTVNRF